MRPDGGENYTSLETIPNRFVLQFVFTQLVSFIKDANLQKQSLPNSISHVFFVKITCSSSQTRKSKPIGVFSLQAAGPFISAPSTACLIARPRFCHWYDGFLRLFVKLANRFTIRTRPDPSFPKLVGFSALLTENAFSKVRITCFVW